MPGREYACGDAERADDAPVMATLEPFIGRRLLWTTSDILCQPDGSAVARRQKRKRRVR
jgi:hypothetical protein